jgi:hypothetical protein
VTLAFIQPGKPTQNAFIERFNRTFRTEVLNANVFRTIREVREHADAFRLDYNHDRPHEGLANQTPSDLQPITQSPSLQLTENKGRLQTAFFPPVNIRPHSMRLTFLAVSISTA